MKTLITNTVLTAVIIANAAWMNTAYAVSPTTDAVTHIRILPHSGVVTKAQVATNVRRVWRGVSPRVTKVEGNKYNARFTYKGALKRVKTNALAPGLYNLTITMKSGGQLWMRTGTCKADAIHIAHNPLVKSTRCK